MKATLRSAFVGIAALAAGALAFAGWTIYAPSNARYAQVETIAHAAAYQDAQFLERAWSLPVAATYRANFEYQSNPSFCGPTSAANVLHSQKVQATQQSVLRNTEITPIFGLLPLGLTLDQEAALLRASTGQAVTAFRNLTLDEFRQHLAGVNDMRRRYVVNFHRGPLFGKGHGHFSPILAYLPVEDLVFVGDVNREFRPFLVPSARLYEAMATIDTATGQKRGLLLIDASSPPRASE